MTLPFYLRVLLRILTAIAEWCPSSTSMHTAVLIVVMVVCSTATNILDSVTTTSGIFICHVKNKAAGPFFVVLLPFSAVQLFDVITNT
jgi:hypothetical protein